MIDRRHVALGTAIAANIASEYPKGGSRLRGIPAEAEDDYDFRSSSDVQAGTTDADSGDLETVSFGEYGAEAIEELWGGRMSVEHSFEDCADGILVPIEITIEEIEP